MKRKNRQILLLGKEAFSDFSSDPEYGHVLTHGASRETQCIYFNLFFGTSVNPKCLRKTLEHMTIEGVLKSWVITTDKPHKCFALRENKRRIH